MEETPTISLSELQFSIKDAIQEKYAEELWVHAEIGALSTNVSGHCYLELVEREGLSFKAKIKATIWAFTYRILKPYFESTTGLELASGIKVAFKVIVEYHEIYGISLNVKDINPSYTIGDIQIQRQKIIRQLEEEGIMDMNAELELSEVPQKIAVISSKTAAGYEDWKHQLINNEYAYAFSFDLYDATMQGDNTTQTIIQALDQIYEREDQYDAVVIIRGGGSKMDLVSFDTYELATQVAQFPLPIICGIGHERDTSIVDMVAHTSLKTPTAVADFLVERLSVFEEKVNTFSADIIDVSKTILQEEHHRIDSILKYIKLRSQSLMTEQSQNLVFLSKQLCSQIKYYGRNAEKSIKLYSDRLQEASQEMLKLENKFLIESIDSIIRVSSDRLNMAQKNITNKERLVFAHSPKHILERGFAIVKQEGTFIKSIHQFKDKKHIEIIFKDGVKQLR